VTTTCPCRDDANACRSPGTREVAGMCPRFHAAAWRAIASRLRPMASSACRCGRNLADPAGRARRVAERCAVRVDGPWAAEESEFSERRPTAYRGARGCRGD
jgi:hypothetical protein